MSGMAQVVAYNSITAFTVADGLIFGRSRFSANSVHTVVKFTCTNASSMYVTSHDFADVVMAPEPQFRIDVQCVTVPSLPKIVERNMLACPWVYNCTTDEIQSITSFIVEHLY